MGTLPPGYRFCPTDEELLICYLRPKALGMPVPEGTVAEVDIYKNEPWDLPGKSALSTKDPEWYFFSIQDKKYSHLARINRTTQKGFWKATGKDRKIYNNGCIVGLKKTLIFYEGRAPKGNRTNWVMHEYRLDEETEKNQNGMSVYVLCRIRKKGGVGPRNGEQYGAPVLNTIEELDDGHDSGELEPSEQTPLYDPGAVDEDYVEEGGNAFNLQNQLTRLMTRPDSYIKVESDETDKSTMSVSMTSGISIQSMNAYGGDNMSAARGIMTGNINPINDMRYESGNIFSDDLLIRPERFVIDDETSIDPLESLLHLPTLTDFDSFFYNDELSSLPLSSGGSDVQHGSWTNETNNARMVLQNVGTMSQNHEALFDGDALRSTGQADVSSESRPSTRAMAQIEACTHGANEDAVGPITRNDWIETIIDFPQVESSTRSYFSKHMPTFSVSKYELAPPKVCHVLLTDSYNGDLELNKKLVSTVIISKDKQPVDCEKFANLSLEHCYAPVIDLQKLKDSRVGNEPTEGNRGRCHLISSMPAKCSAEVVPRNDESEEVILPASTPHQNCLEDSSLRNQKLVDQGEVDVDPATNYFSKRQRVRNWLKNKLKHSAMGVNIIHMEGMQMKLDDRQSSHAKTAAGPHEQMEHGADAYDNSKCGIMWILFLSASVTIRPKLPCWGLSRHNVV